MTEELAAPSPAEVDVTIIGPGRGECVVVHLGGGKWAIVDSCVHPDGTAAGLRYLAGMGVGSEAVALLVATHWHDDHIRGFSQLVEECPAAVVALSTALKRDEFLTLVESDSDLLVRSMSGVREMGRSIKALVGSARQHEFAIADRRLYRDEANRAEAWALSPSSASVQQAMEGFGELLPKRGASRRAIPRPARNPACVVLFIKVGDVELLLGADLECSSDPSQGWSAIVSSAARPRMRAHFLKVPHHGSADSHDDAMWSHLVEHHAHAGLTPFRSGSVRLPRPTDVQRIATLTPNAWLTRHDDGGKSKRRSRAVEKTINEATRRMRSVSVEPARVTFRCGADHAGEWTVTPSPQSQNLVVTP